jgi:hypothetical protein
MLTMYVVCNRVVGEGVNNNYCVVPYYIGCMFTSDTELGETQREEEMKGEIERGRVGWGWGVLRERGEKGRDGRRGERKCDYKILRIEPVLGNCSSAWTTVVVTSCTCSCVHLV